MTYYEHVPFRENIPAYALGALDTEECAALESHLQTCDSCRAELADYRSTSESAFAMLPPQQPSAALRKRLQGQLPGAKKAGSTRLPWSFSRLAVGIAVLLLLALNLFSFLQVRVLRNQQ